jgi:predicted Zn-dependent protease
VSGGESLLEVLEALGHRGWPEVEVFHKRGRSRTMHFTAYGDATSLRQEEGWAVRAGDRRRSFFYAETGAPRPDAPWPEADGSGLRLPSARPVPPWSAPSSIDAPLLGESEARGLFTGLARQLDDELPGARLLAGRLDDGSSEGWLASSREVTASVRQRAASLYLEAVGPGGGSRLSLEVAERDARRLSPAALARRLADLLLVAEKGSARPRDRGDFLLAPAVTASLLAALEGLWLGPGATERVSALRGRRGAIGSSALTLVDDGRLPGGVLEAPVDGEGQPTREVVLVEEGIFRQPLLAWWQTLPEPKRAAGCALRPGWRDLPRPGPSHLYLRPDPATRVTSLLEDVGRGYYLIGTSGAPRFEPARDRFALPVSGFAMSGGRARGAVAGAWLVGSVSALFKGIVAKARDLSFSPIGRGMVGSPTVLVKGLELRQRI